MLKILFPLVLPGSTGIELALGGDRTARIELRGRTARVAKPRAAIFMGFVTNCSVAGDCGSCLITWKSRRKPAFSCTPLSVNGTDGCASLLHSRDSRGK